MLPGQRKIQATEVVNHLNNCYKNLNQLLLQGDNQELLQIRQKMINELEDYRKDGILSVAFVGQYSAGKSTIISAITGKRDIKIDADIATDATSNYYWEGINLIDTPGLFTERKDHDYKTYNAIHKADLLVFCLTSMLFDSITIENFKKLAYEKGYRWKMMLVVNKMSDEAGDDEQKIINYRKSLAEALKPYKIDEFSLCFIDAKDYCEGIDTDDDFLIEISRFDSFTDSLNNFVDSRRSLARLDTPVRIVLSGINDAQICISRDNNEDTAFFEILKRLSRTVNQERERLRNKVKNIALNLCLAVTNEGTILASALGDGNSEICKEQTEINVRTHYEKATNDMEYCINDAFYSIQKEIESVFNSDLVKTFVNRLQFQYEIYAENSDAGIDLKKIVNQIKELSKIGEKIGINSFRNNWTNTYQGEGFLRSIDVAGSQLHHAVRSVGESLGYNFRPWEAVNLAKDIGNSFMIIGNVVAGLGVLSEIYQLYAEKKLSDARLNITSQFIKMGESLKEQINEQLAEIEIKLYGEIENQIAEARRKQEESITSANKGMQQLTQIRNELESILQKITKASTKLVG
ncbi:GTPase [Sphaerospermopsis sp. LEGE 08334]|uniref:GTPase n=1 Tax=Sphaerospermopsis sp. LEGE 08334 TaxID=1828651 RepID=UPI0018800EBD|nr:GTPase [Sphaerospermopsis sp. LEGE 08334]MBE9058655.1 50S ribosome-binding GTPase [Sphaerospermopsis sp. LEGE 08334]